MKRPSEAEVHLDVDSRFVAQFVELWIEPEIQRRRSESELPTNFSLFAAQVIMNFDEPVQVRLNEEVIAIVRWTPLSRQREDEK
jgi:hypothetical protein